MQLGIFATISFNLGCRKSMPELPEVESLTRSMKRLACGHVFSDVKFYRQNLRVPIPIQFITTNFIGQKVTAIYRRSKYMLMEAGDVVLIIHLGMSGYMMESPSVDPTVKHTHAVFALQPDKNTGAVRYIHYVDPRRFGMIVACFKSELKTHPLFHRLGPEPLGFHELSDYLFKKSRGKTVAVKNFIMNAHILVGVGNIYANEALFLSGIHPNKPAGKVTRAAYQRLGPNIDRVLRAAIKAGGTTLRDFRKPSGEPGYFSVELRVYGKLGENCEKCGHPIEMIRLGGRSSFYCPTCQK